MTPSNGCYCGVISTRSTAISGSPSGHSERVGQESLFGDYWFFDVLFDNLTECHVRFDFSDFDSDVVALLGVGHDQHVAAFDTRDAVALLVDIFDFDIVAEFRSEIRSEISF